MKRTSTLIMLGCAAMALTACENITHKEAKYGSLSRQLLLVDQEGTRYGTVEMDPVTGGKLLDTEGRVIGTIVTPAITSTVTTVSPTTSGY